MPETIAPVGNINCLVMSGGGTECQFTKWVIFKCQRGVGILAFF